MIIGRTEVVIDEGQNTTYLALNETLIAFGTAVEDKRYDVAMDILEGLPYTLETEAMWQQLSQITLKARKLHIAERCFAALGDVAKSRYLQKINKLIKYVEKELVPGSDGMEYYEVQARLELLEKHFHKAEELYLEQVCLFFICT